MKRVIRTSIALSILSISTAALPAMAADDSMRVTVPFPFTAGNMTLPAGDYVISQQMDNHILTIGGKGGAAMLAAMPQEAVGQLKASNLTFERSSKGNALMGVQMYGKPSLILNRTK